MIIKQQLDEALKAWEIARDSNLPSSCKRSVSTAESLSRRQQMDRQ